MWKKQCVCRATNEKAVAFVVLFKVISDQLFKTVRQSRRSVCVSDLYISVLDKDPFSILFELRDPLYNLKFANSQSSVSPRPCMDNRYVFISRLKDVVFLDFSTGWQAGFELVVLVSVRLEYSTSSGRMSLNNRGPSWKMELVWHFSRAGAMLK